MKLFTPTDATARFAQGTVFLIFLLPLLAILTPTRHSAWRNAQRASCQSNLKQLVLAVKQYRQDNSERFPLVGNEKYGWGNALSPYLKSWLLFQCPGAEPRPSQPVRIWRSIFGTPPPNHMSSDYWYNAQLAGVTSKQLNLPARTFLMGDGINNSPTNTALSQFPDAWVKADESMPGRRHLDGLNFAFADGHVKWMRPEKATTRLSKAGQPTFKAD